MGRKGFPQKVMSRVRADASTVMGKHDKYFKSHLIARKKEVTECYL